jgi:hypothetical protein
MRIHALLALSLILFPFLLHGQVAVPHEYIGKWIGTVHQEGYSSYEVTIVVLEGNAGDKTGRIYYTTLGCEGDLVYQGLTTDEGGKEYAKFKEVLRSGEGKCIDEGTVLLYIHDQQMRYVWQHKDYPDSEAAAEMSRL